MRRPITLIALLLAAANLAAQPVSAPHITVELVPASAAVAPGKPFRIGLRIELEKDWHVYWRNPGDAGLATAFALTLPAGYTASDVEWPAPHLFGDPPEVSYGYEGVVILPVTITPPASATDATITIGATTSWLVCNDVCIPGKAELSLELPVDAATAEIPSEHGEQFATAEAQLPRTARKIDVTAIRAGDRYEIVIANDTQRMVPLPTDLLFFASEEGVIDHSAKQAVETKDGAVVLTVPVSSFEEKVPTRLRGVLVSSAGWNGGGLRAITVDAPIAIERDADEPVNTSANSRE